MLVIDDSPAARLTIIDLLEESGYQTLSLASAIGATRTIIRNNISVVIADISMPGLSGDRLVRVLRENPRLKHLTIIVVSGRSEQELDDVRQTLDAEAVLSKGELAERLIPELEAALNVPSSRRAAFSQR